MRVFFFICSPHLCVGFLLLPLRARRPPSAVRPRRPPPAPAAHSLTLTVSHSLTHTHSHTLTHSLTLTHTHSLTREICVAGAAFGSCLKGLDVFERAARGSVCVTGAALWRWRTDFVAGAVFSASGCVFAWQGQHLVAV